MKVRWLTIKRVVVIAGLIFALFNFVAYRHAYRLTHFVEGHDKTRAPNRLNRIQKASVLLSGVVMPRPVNDRSASDIGPTNRTVSITTRDGMRLEAWDIAGNPEVSDVVLLFPGHAVAKSSMVTEARVWHELGCRVVLVDFRGTGGSEGDTTTLGWNEAIDVAATMAWARQKYPSAPVILAGESMGAAAVLRAVATEKLTPDGVVVACPFDRLLTTVKHRYELMGLPSFPAAQTLVFWGGVQHGFNAFRLNPVEYARQVRCPALVIAGRHDPWVQVAEAQAVADAMRGRTSFSIFENSSHAGYARNEPEHYHAVVKDWYDGLKSGTVER